MVDPVIKIRPYLWGHNLTRTPREFNIWEFNCDVAHGITLKAGDVVDLDLSRELHDPLTGPKEVLTKIHGLRGSILYAVQLPEFDEQRLRKDDTVRVWGVRFAAHGQYGPFDGENPWTSFLEVYVRGCGGVSNG